MSESRSLTSIDSHVSGLGGAIYNLKEELNKSNALANKNLGDIVSHFYLMREVDFKRFEATSYNTNKILNEISISMKETNVTLREISASMKELIRLQKDLLVLAATPATTSTKPVAPVHYDGNSIFSTDLSSSAYTRK